jgi:hypothetical protein
VNGPEHYREAERLLVQAAAVPAAASARGDSLVTAQTGHAMLAAEAQVHATLALAAATAYPAVKDYTGDEDGSVSRGWAGVA